LIGLTRSAALDYAGQGIRIDAVFPGMNKTPMLVQQPARAYRPANSGVDR
jgi:NAD(P)-dependent dehydrogenase (short-subunit alcohol dehydrogenase family)